MDIKNFVNQHNTSPKEAISLRDLALIKSRLSAEKSKYLDISSLKEGTVLKGEVLDIKQNITTILTNKGQLFNGKLATDLPINIGENREFIVTNKNGTQSLSLLEKPPSEIQNQKVLDTLKELGVKPDPKNIELANKMIANKMPINKETLQQVKSGVYFFENSTDKSNATNKSIFLAKNNIPPTKENTETLNNINSKENTLPKNLNDIFQKINNIPDKKIQAELKELFKPLVDNTTKDSSTTTKENINNNVVLKENSLNKNQMDTILKGKNNKVLEQTLENKTEENTAQSKDNIETLKDTKEKNIFDLKDSPKDIDKDMNDLKSNLEKSLKLLEKATDDKSEELKTELKSLNNKLDFYNDTKNNTFLQIPLTMNGEQREASINVFNDKKTKKSNDDYITALVSIFTDNLGLFGTYIQKDKRKLTLQFRLESKETEQAVRKNINTLKGLLQPLNYTIENISFKDISEDDKKNNIEVLEMDILEISDDIKPIIFNKKG